MFDNHNSISLVDKLEEYAEKLVNIGKMETCCGLIKDIKRFPRVPLGQLPRELYSLCFSTGKGSSCLAQPDIAKTDLVKNLQFVLNKGEGIEDSMAWVLSFPGYRQCSFPGT